MFENNFYKNKRKRCFILATGPSLLDVDLSLIRDEITIGVNAIQKSGCVTDYIVVSDAETIERDVDIIMNENEEVKHFIYGECSSNRFQSKTIEKMKIFKNVHMVYNKEKENIKMPPMHERSVELCRERYYIDSMLEFFSTYGGSVVQDFVVVKEFLKTLGVKLYNCSPTNNFKELKYIELNKLMGEVDENNND